MTIARAKQLIDRMTDDDLIDMATTCSNRGIALAAEMQLRDRHPSKVRIRKGKRQEAQPK